MCQLEIRAGIFSLAGWWRKAVTAEARACGRDRGAVAGHFPGRAPLPLPFIFGDAVRIEGELGC